MIENPVRARLVTALVDLDTQFPPTWAVDRAGKWTCLPQYGWPDWAKEYADNLRTLIVAIDLPK